MIHTLAETLVVIAGGAIAALCLYGLRNPRALIAGAARIWRRPDGRTIAILIRLLLGLNLLFAAAASRYPMGFLGLGLVELAAAILLLLLGRAPVDHLVERLEGMAPFAQRLLLLAGLALGVFLVVGAS